MDNRAAAITLYDAITSLGPWFGAGGATAIIVAYFGMRSRTAAVKEQETGFDKSSPRWFFDGPIGRVIDLLRGIYEETRDLRRDIGDSERNRSNQHSEICGILRGIERSRWQQRAGRPNKENLS